MQASLQRLGFQVNVLTDLNRTQLIEGLGEFVETTKGSDAADRGELLVECRSAQLMDINTRLASASNDKDRKAITRERTELSSALKTDVDLTGGVVDQPTNMAKTFTQGRAVTDGSSEADVLGGRAQGVDLLRPAVQPRVWLTARGRP